MIITEQTNITYKEKPFCPLCGSEDLDRYDSSSGDGKSYEFVQCEGCAAQWTEVYVFEKIIDLKESDCEEDEE